MHLRTRLYLFLFIIVHLSFAVWTKFDFVRREPGKWGSKGTTPFVKINALNNNGPELIEGARFGCSVTNIGDLDGNGVEDLAVGAKGESSFWNGAKQLQAGAVYILFLAKNRTVLSFTRISGEVNGGPLLYANDQFGYSVGAIGDLNGDGVMDIAVGAPGNYVSQVFILFLSADGSAQSTVVVRGKFSSQLPTASNITKLQVFNITGRNTSYTNGPPITYLSAFGSNIASVGDFDKDGIPDFAVTAADFSGGESKVYILFMRRNGVVASYSTIGNGIGGGPNLNKFVSFGSSVVVVGDLDGDGVTELAIGSRDNDDGVSYRSGVVYLCFMNADGTVRSYKKLSERGDGKFLPLVAADSCGSGLAVVGDINMDDRKQQHPEQYKAGRSSVPDIVIGCPQANYDGGSTGRIAIGFLSQVGDVLDYVFLPSATDSKARIGLDLKKRDEFGASLAPMQDLDENGINEIVVGAPGDADSGQASGAIYIIFLRRKKYHQKYPCEACFYGMILGACIAFVTFCIISCALFFYIFRRRPDEIEIAVKKGGVEITKNRERKKKTKDSKVHAEGYMV